MLQSERFPLGLLSKGTSNRSTITARIANKLPLNRKQQDDEQKGTYIQEPKTWNGNVQTNVRTNKSEQC